MSGAVGSGALVVATVMACVAAGAWFRASVGRGDRRRPRVATAASALSASLVVLAVSVMLVGLVAHDSRLEYVVRVADPGMSMYYRVTALWSAMEGSLLLWLLALSVVTVGFVVTTGRGPAPSRGVAAGVLSLLVAAFAVIALVADPFASTAGGVGPPPSPLLQDHPAMGVHPPLLYAGFAALAAPFALSCEALLVRSTRGQWARSVHRWALLAWVPLAAGIALGAWWSYAVLGWGGYWAWDPVENASLMPLLLATALLHASSPRTRGSGWRRWTVALAGLPFLFVLLGTFVTRSGVVQSIHAFSASTLGPLLLGVLVLATLGWVGLLVRPGALPPAAEPAPVLSRQTALQVNRVVLSAVTVVVLVGSILPAVLLATTGDRVSVGPPWYAKTLGPAATLLLAVMAAAPWLPWSGDSSPGASARRLRLPLGLAALTTGGVGLAVSDIWIAVTAGLAAAVVVAPLARRDSGWRTEYPRLGAHLAHVGVAVGAVAVVAGGQAVVTERTIPIGGSLSAGATTATLVALDRFGEGNRRVAEARIVLGDGDGDVLGEARPQLRWYERQATVLAGPDIRTELWRDVYVTLLDVDAAEGGATVRLAVTPLASWLWLSAAFAIAGALLSAFPRRRGTPERTGVHERAKVSS